jgi:hypothetical protein
MEQTDKEAKDKILWMFEDFTKAALRGALGEAVGAASGAPSPDIYRPAKGVTGLLFSALIDFHTYM